MKKIYKELSYPSNLLSVFRLLFTVPMAYFLVNDKVSWVITCFIIAYITDLLDGWLARKLNQITETGKIIDPIADKFFIGAAALILIINGTAPLWFGITVVARDLIILAGGLFAAKKLGYVIPSNYTGKVTVVIIAISFVGLFLKIDLINPYGLIIATLAIILSLIVYAVSMVKKLKYQLVNKDNTQNNRN